jgi:hypothetical protein
VASANLEITWSEGSPGSWTALGPPHRGIGEDFGRLPPWIAAEHRNTEHHVHVIMAARVKTKERPRTVMITKPRLERMKDAMSMELNRQNGLRLANAIGRGPGLRTAVGTTSRGDPLRRVARGDERVSRAVGRPSLTRGLASFFGAMAQEGARQAQLQRAEARKREFDRQQEHRLGRDRCGEGR